MFLEELVQPGKIVKRPGQPVQLVDHDEIDFPVRNVRQEPLQRGAVGIPSAEPAVIVMFRQADPALFRLDSDVILAGLPLSVQRVEFGIEIFIRVLARVDRAAYLFDFILHLCYFGNCMVIYVAVYSISVNGRNITVTQ